MTTIAIADGLTTIDGKFYAGMTIEDAKKKDLEISLFNTIDALDGQKTGSLSKEDIIKHRDIECGKNAGLGLLGTIATVAAAFSGGPIGWALAGLGAIATSSLFYKCESQDAVTDKYR